MSFSVSIRPPNLSKKARPPPRDIPAASMNCQIIFIPYLIPERPIASCSRAFLRVSKIFSKTALSIWQFLNFLGSGVRKGKSQITRFRGCERR